MLAYNFDTLDFVLAVFSPLMSFSFLFNGRNINISLFPL